LKFGPVVANGLHFLGVNFRRDPAERDAGMAWDFPVSRHFFL
jgi:hypothetical protein